ALVLVVGPLPPRGPRPGDRQVPVAHDRGDLGPVDGHVEPHPGPTAWSDVRRHEEAVGSGSDEYLLGAGRRRAPEGHPIIVVTVREGGELPPADVPGRLAVAEALTDVRVGQAQLAQLRHGTHQPARWCSAIRSRITWSYSGK